MDLKIISRAIVTNNIVPTRGTWIQCLSARININTAFYFTSIRHFYKACIATQSLYPITEPTTNIRSSAYSLLKFHSHTCSQFLMIFQQN